MSAIGPGDWVECIKAAKGAAPTAELTLGALYQVRGLREGVLRGAPGVGIYLVGIVNPKAKTGKEWAYSIERFRPIYRPNAEFIERLKHPAPADLVEV